MSRTYRRRSERHEYCWVLCDWNADAPSGARAMLDRHSREGRRAIARFHSDAEFTMRSGAPHWFRRIFKRRLRNANARQLRRWLLNPGYDPVMQPRHRHTATWAWW